MNKNLKLGLFVGVPVLVGGYFAYKYFTRPSDKVTLPEQQVDPVTGEVITISPAPTTNPFQQYVVKTLVSNLNVRQSPNTSSAIVASLKKGSSVYARPSSTSGWFEYSADGSNVTGFVSSMYLSK